MVDHGQSKLVTITITEILRKQLALPTLTLRFWNILSVQYLESNKHELPIKTDAFISGLFCSLDLSVHCYCLEKGEKINT
jgi:hypothetical protein